MCAGLRRQAAIRKVRSLLCYQSRHQDMKECRKEVDALLHWHPCPSVASLKPGEASHVRTSASTDAKEVASLKASESAEALVNWSCWLQVKFQSQPKTKPSAHASTRAPKAPVRHNSTAKIWKSSRSRLALLCLQDPSLSVRRPVQRQLLSDWRSGRKRCPELNSPCHLRQGQMVRLARLEPFKTYLADLA